ncbi:PAS domain S-box [Desulfocapsa sulfexigens DSM 10523]|uniref:histidine kinase n=1 Tax=Desulfocapsa sulfexigens (strain DSM 10523 / SB164P1) TaxID=1167006 RepID=M1PG51_DESSD|nr:PAS domain-containing protein [Desulfocapsa sulfexigens]AGF78645.1 PAS domain S-box [Desulfocapsa sulfexigens DSM 10523]
MNSKLLKRRRLRDLPLGYKFSFLVSGVVIMLGIASIFFVESKVSHALHIEHRERGFTIARHLATHCVDLIFTDNRIKLYQLLSEIKSKEKDIAYLFVVDTKKEVFAHTFGKEGFPKVLLTANPLTEGESFSYNHLQFDNDKNIVDELTVPLLEGIAGELHIGLCEKFILQKIQTLRMQLIGIASIICLFGVLAAFFFARIMSKPLQTLSIASDKFGRGEAIQELPVIAHDEIGRLTATFNQMVTKIKRSRAKQVTVEKALRTSKKEWERTFNALTDIVTLQTPDLCIIKSNTSGCVTLGLSSNAIQGRHCYELFHGSSQPCPGCPLVQTSKTFSPYTKEMYHKKLGKTFLVSASPVKNESGELTHIVHVATDITTIKKSEEDRIRLKAAIDQASETVVITDVDGTIQYVNPAFETLTGYSRDIAIGKNPRILNSGKQDSQFYAKMWAELEQGKVWKGHLINRKKDGSLFEEEATISPVRNNEGRITNFVAVKRNVTKEVSLEKQLRQAMKMEAIGTLAGGIAHDFNNILAAMIGYSEIAKQQLGDDDPVKKDIEQVLIAGTRAADLVKQILTFSRQGEEILKPLNIQSIIKEVLKLLRASLPTTITLRESIAPSCGKVLADPTQIHQVLMNLCTNAKDAIGGAIGTLSVSLTEKQISETETIADCPQIEHGTYLDLEISDTGCGIDTLTRTHIFDPFFTTKGIGKGTGLGLSVVHGIIKQHQGEITVTSTVNKGTTFNIYLPVIDKHVVEKEQLLTDALPGGDERILLVDDEPAITHLLERILGILGYKVTVVSSSTEALKIYSKNPEEFDLVITDMTMPEMTGTDLAMKLLAIQPKLPIILCTGFSEAMNEAQARLLGIREYIRKPIDTLALAKAIRKALPPS